MSFLVNDHLFTLEGVVVFLCRVCHEYILQYAVFPELMRYFGRGVWVDLSGMGVGGMVDGSVGHYGNKGLCIKRE